MCRQKSQYQQAKIVRVGGNVQLPEPVLYVANIIVSVENSRGVVAGCLFLRQQPSFTNRYHLNQDTYVFNVQLDFYLPYKCT